MEKDSTREKKNRTKLGLQDQKKEQHAMNGCKGVFSTFILHDMTLSSSCKNRWVLLRSIKIIKIINFTEWNDKPYIYGCKIEKIDDFYEFPIPSSKLFTFQSNLKELPPTLWKLDDIQCKLFCIEKSSNVAVFQPLLHTIKS